MGISADSESGKFIQDMSNIRKQSALFCEWPCANSGQTDGLTDGLVRGGGEAMWTRMQRSLWKECCELGPDHRPPEHADLCMVGSEVVRSQTGSGNQELSIERP